MIRMRNAIAVLAVFALLAAACGDDEPEAPVETQPPATVIDTSAQEAAKAAEEAAQSCSGRSRRRVGGRPGRAGGS